MEIIILGIILLVFTSKKGLAKGIIIAGVVVMAALSFGPVSDLLLEPLEHKYQPLRDTRPYSEIKWIVVLGAGHNNDPRLPGALQLSGPSLARLVEALRLHARLPGAKIILSEGGYPGMDSGAKIMAEIAAILGTDSEDLILESESKDTRDQARRIRKMVGGDSVILVTSASHMPRSVALFKKQGIQPIPAPTFYLAAKKPGKRELRDYLPTAEAAFKTEVAFHEYLGLIWGKLRGQI